MSALTAPPESHPRAASDSPIGEKRSFRANLVLLAVGAQGGLALVMALGAQPLSDWSTLGGAVTALSRLTAMVGTYLCLVLLLLIARLPWLEREFGQDGLNRWHRKIAPYSLYLISAHIALVAVGIGVTRGNSAWNQFWLLVLGTPWMMPALVGFLFLAGVGVTSYKRARRRMSYETWWLIHLLSYLGVALSFFHQIDSGAMFLDHKALRGLWLLMYLQLLLTIVGGRLVTPLWRSWRHQLRVERVVRETADTISVVVKGRDLDRLSARGGQFFGWHFLVRGKWWESHPYSLSAPPRNNRMRITVRDLGDHSHWLARVQPGTRVAIEGPHGVFTADRAESKHVVLVAGGVGIAPVRALLEELSADQRVDLLWRASNADQLPLRAEIESLAAMHNASIHYLIGSRREQPLTATRLRALVPGIAAADVFLCGPAGLVEGAVASLEALGVPPERIHDETFHF